MRTFLSPRFPVLSYLPICLIAVSFCLPAWGGGRKKTAPSPDSAPLSMIVVPDKIVPLHIGFDLQGQFPTVMVSYESGAPADRAKIHVWGGASWIPIELRHYESGAFLKKKPAQVMVIGDSGELAPRLEQLAKGWVPEVYLVNTVQSAKLLNAFAPFYGFNKDHWNYFGERYGLNIRNTNVPDGYTSWYDLPYVDETKGGSGAGIRSLVPARPSPDFEVPQRSTRPAPISAASAPRASAPAPLPNVSAPVQSGSFRSGFSTGGTSRSSDLLTPVGGGPAARKLTPIGGGPAARDLQPFQGLNLTP